MNNDTYKHGCINRDSHVRPRCIQEVESSWNKTHHSDTFVLAQWGYTTLLRAADAGSVPVLRMLLEDYGSSVDELAQVSTEVLHVTYDGAKQ